jgi:drug/metabolite transporter (DMT)-like permease
MKYQLREELVVPLGYMVSCTTLLVGNKLVIQHIPAPSTVTGVQLATAAAFAAVLRLRSPDTTDALEWEKVKPYIGFIFFFFSSLYFNLSALRASSVGTMLVVRACSPLCVCLVEWLLLGRHLPSRRSAAMLGCLALCALGYVLLDKEFRVRGDTTGYLALALYFGSVTATDSFGKWVVSGLQWKSMWGPVLYSNTLSLVPTLLTVAGTGEARALRHVEWSLGTCLLLAATCPLSVSISYFTWRCRQLMSATSFALLGTANKLLTVLFAALIWEPPSLLGLLCLCGCLSAAATYRQPPLRQAADAALSRADASRALGGCVGGAACLVTLLLLLLSPAAVAAPAPTPSAAVHHPAAPAAREPQHRHHGGSTLPQTRRAAPRAPPPAGSNGAREA